MKPAFKEGQLWRSTNQDHFGWCKHGLFRIENAFGTLTAVDTYWGEYSGDRRHYNPETIRDSLKFVIDLTECRTTHKDEYDRYPEADRAYIPIGGGSEKYWVRISAKPDPERVKQQLESKARELRRDIDWNTRQLEDIEAKLAEMVVVK